MPYTAITPFRTAVQRIVELPQPRQPLPDLARIPGESAAALLDRRKVARPAMEPRYQGAVEFVIVKPDPVDSSDFIVCPSDATEGTRTPSPSSTMVICREVNWHGPSHRSAGLPGRRRQQPGRPSLTPKRGIYQRNRIAGRRAGQLSFGAPARAVGSYGTNRPLASLARGGRRPGGLHLPPIGRPQHPVDRRQQHPARHWHHPRRRAVGGAGSWQQDVAAVAAVHGEWA